MFLFFCLQMLTSATTITFVVANLVSILLEAIDVLVVQVTRQQNKIKNAKVRSKVDFIVTKQLRLIFKQSLGSVAESFDLSCITRRLTAVYVNCALSTY